MTYDVKQIEGIGVTYGHRLEAIGIHTIADLLTKGGTKSGRQHIAEKTEIPESLILTWVNHADLMRIDGIAGHFSELLEASGVDTVKEFAHRNAEHLHVKMTEVNNQYGLAGRVPSVETLQQMIEQAKKMDQKVFH
jgi:predicted flap endonuclease-1-like 5' DNA nuclease